MPQPRLLGERRRAERGLEHRLEVDLLRVKRFVALGVVVHQLCEQALVERAPVHPDAHRLLVLDGDLDDGPEVVVAMPRSDVPRIDAILREQGGGLRELLQQQVTVVMEIADDRHAHAQIGETLDDLGHGSCRLVVVDRDANDLRACPGECGDLRRGGDRIGRVRVRHGLDDHGLG